MVEEVVKTSQGEIKVTAVSMGNPHGVIFVDRIEDVDFDVLGPELEFMLSGLIVPISSFLK